MMEESAFFLQVLVEKNGEIDGDGFQMECDDHRETFGYFLEKIHRKYPEWKDYNAVANLEKQEYWPQDLITDWLRPGEKVILRQTSPIQKRSYSRKLGLKSSTFDLSAYEKASKEYQFKKTNQDIKNRQSLGGKPTRFSQSEWSEIQDETCLLIVKNDVEGMIKRIEEYPELADAIILQERGLTGLHYSIEMGAWEIVMLFLRKTKNINAFTAKGKTPLMMLLKWKSNSAPSRKSVKISFSVSSEEPIIPILLQWKLFYTMIEKGANINCENNQGKTALMYAAKNGFYEIVKFLLEHGADPFAKTSKKKTCLDYAQGSIKISRFLENWVKLLPGSNLESSSSYFSDLSKEDSIVEISVNKTEHVLIIVPGIEEKDESFWEKTVYQIGSNRDEARLQIGATQHVEILFTEWHEQFRQKKEREISQLLHHVDLLSTFVTHTITDTFYLMHPVFAELIYSEICVSINETYRKFKERNPDFNGKVSILAHSFAGIVVWDLLVNQEKKIDMSKISSDSNIKVWSEQMVQTGKKTKGPSKHILKNFPQIQLDIENLFLIGSSVSVHSAMRGESSEDCIPNCVNILNIIHPNDPLSYRIEPWIHPSFAKLEPEPLKFPSKIPHRRESWNQTLELFVQNRFDYQLRLDVTSPREWSTFSTSIEDHNSYWSSKDLFVFILEQILFTKGNLPPISTN